MMRFSAVALLAVLAVPASAQVTVGFGGGTGVGTRGGNASSTHEMGFVEFDLPIVPTIRADAVVANTTGAGTISLVASGVYTLPIPGIKPYVIAGLGLYGLDGNGTRSGWSAGAGVRTALPGGPGVFVEVRRHQRIARDLLTVGIRL